MQEKTYTRMLLIKNETEQQNENMVSTKASIAVMK